MSFAINIQDLLDRASKRAARVANVATLLPDEISRVATVATVATVSARKGGNPMLTREQGDACHSPSWSDSEIQAFTARRDRLLRWGYSDQDADDLAERLTLRDREADDRRVCAECHHGRSRRCPDGIPMPRDVLHRCVHFATPIAAATPRGSQ